MAESSDSVEQCEPARRALKTWADICLTGGHKFRARTLEFSTTGIAIVAPTNLAAKTPLEVSCAIPLRNGKFIAFRAHGHVSYSIYCSEANGFRIGIAFHQLTRTSVAALQQGFA